ncbi:nuclear transport factor 2 family protein [Paratissierella segnis]|jgi:hypothetical protein|nr:nuclear transport factor 2 family protein [Paratissierella segnis]
MTGRELVVCLWDEMASQNWDKVKLCFDENAIIRWHNTNESFNVEEFILVNSKYPGNWNISIKRIEQSQNVIISVALAQSLDSDVCAYATSFFEVENGKIICLDEYWGDVTDRPQWREAVV